MATKRISELTLRSSFDATCNVPVDDSTQSFRTTGQQLRNYIAPLTTIGDLLYATTAGVAARLAIGSAQQILKPVAGVPAWAWPFSTQRSATSTDSINATTDHVLLYDSSGGAFTATLPTAASMAGKTYIIKKTDSSLNAITIATTSSQTIDGITTTTLNTQYETLQVVSDGSNWHVIQRLIPSALVAYTPTVSAFGTVSGVSIFSQRDRDCLIVQGNVTSGTPLASEMQLTLGYAGSNAPTGLTIDSTKVASIRIVGRAQISATANTVDFTGRTVLGNGGNNYLNFSAEASTLNSAAAQAGNIIGGTSTPFTFFARVPITGWKS